jgi:hypothetical protein
LGGKFPIANFDIDGIIATALAMIGNSSPFGLGILPTPTDKAFDAIDGIFGISDRLTFGQLSH